MVNRNHGRGSISFCGRVDHRVEEGEQRVKNNFKDLSKKYLKTYYSRSFMKYIWASVEILLDWNKLKVALVSHFTVIFSIIQFLICFVKNWISHTYEKN